MSKEMIGKVVRIIDNGNKLAINKGKRDSVVNGMQFIVYEKTEELFDPDTGESLGELNISKGEGRVIDVQETMSIVKSDKVAYKGGIGMVAMIAYGREAVSVPFDNAKEGDFAKLIGYEEDDSSACIRCGNEIEEELQEEGSELCGYCQHQKEKLDKE